MEAAINNLDTLVKPSPPPMPWYYDFGWPAFAMALIGVIIVVVGIRAIMATRDPAVGKRTLVVHVLCVAFAAAMGVFLHQYMEFRVQGFIEEDTAQDGPAARRYIAKHDMVSSVVVTIGTFLSVVSAVRAKLIEQDISPHS